jgi:hypothetical protein
MTWSYMTLHGVLHAFTLKCNAIIADVMLVVLAILVHTCLHQKIMRGDTYWQSGSCKTDCWLHPIASLGFSTMECVEASGQQVDRERNVQKAMISVRCGTDSTEGGGGAAGTAAARACQWRETCKSAVTAAVHTMCRTVPLRGSAMHRMTIASGGTSRVTYIGAAVQKR